MQFLRCCSSFLLHDFTVSHEFIFKLVVDCERGHYLLMQGFSTGVPRNPWVPCKALGVPPISVLDIDLLVNCSWGCCQIVVWLTKGARIKKRLRNTVLMDRGGNKNNLAFLLLSKKKELEKCVAYNFGRFLQTNHQTFYRTL